MARGLTAIVLLLVPLSLNAQDRSSLERLASLGRVWGHVLYHHPYLAYRELDWDAALVATIPAVLAARNVTEYRGAVQRMLQALDDPLTRIVEPGAAARDIFTGDITLQVDRDSVVIVTLPDYYRLGEPASQAALRNIPAALPSARAVVFDLRTDPGVDEYGRYQLASTLEFLERLIDPVGGPLPGTRRLVHYGFSSPSAFSSGQYRSGFFTRFPPPIRPAVGARNIPAVYLLNQHSPVPPSAVALQARGKALIVVEGSRPPEPGSTTRLTLRDSLVVDVRIAEPVHADGTSGELLPDAIVGRNDPGQADAALQAALVRARAFAPSSHRGRPLPAVAALPSERSYPMEYPSTEHRLLGLFRFWSTIETFYPYKHLLEQSWDSVLIEFLPRFLRANDALAYQRAIAEMATRLHDSHAYVAGNRYSRDLIGEGYPPIRVRLIEGQPVVVSLLGQAATRSGIKVGDVVLTVDGEKALERLARAQSLISASTEHSAHDKASLVFMNGTVGSPVRLRIRRARGEERDIRLIRQQEDFTTLYHRERTGDIVRILPENIGYVDLDRLTYDMVDSMFSQLRDTRAIIFDMRGYPHGTFWAIAPRLSSREQPAALLETPMPGHDSPAPAVESSYQTILPTPPGAWVYTGATVMLMDERTQSQAEHTGLFLRAANGTKFVGSPTAGANGELVTLRLPGSVTVGFTGQSVRHPDGRQLQRVGLVPDVLALPTVQGVREGRDEVLQAALELLAGN